MMLQRIARGTLIRAWFTDAKEGDNDFNKTAPKIEITNENSQQIIKKWVTENRVVLFMKGTPLNPRCGYSNFVV